MDCRLQIWDVRCRMPKGVSISRFIFSSVEVIEHMRMWIAAALILCGLVLVFLVAAFFFMFNPLGLG